MTLHQNHLQQLSGNRLNIAVAIAYIFVIVFVKLHVGISHASFILLIILSGYIYINRLPVVFPVILVDAGIWFSSPFSYMSLFYPLLYYVIVKKEEKRLSIYVFAYLIILMAVHVFIGSNGFNLLYIILPLSFGIIYLLEDKSFKELTERKSKLDMVISRLKWLGAGDKLPSSQILTNLDKILSNFLFIIKTALKAERIIMFIEDNNAYKISLIIGEGKNIDKSVSIGYGEGIIGWAVKEKNTVVLKDNDVAIAIRTYRKKEKTLPYSIVIHPVINKHEVDSIILFEFESRFTIDIKAVLEQMDVYILSVKSLIENYIEENLQVQKATLLYNMSKELSSTLHQDKHIRTQERKRVLYERLFDILKKLFNYDAIGFVEIKKNTGYIIGKRGENIYKFNEPFNKDEGLIGAIIDKDGYIIKKDIIKDGIVRVSRKEPSPVNRSFLSTGFPLLDDTYGGIWIEKKEPSQFSEVDGKILKIASSIFASLYIGVMHQDYLEKQAYTDGLTGLNNHRTFQSKLEELIKKGGELALFILDLDHFKSINDTYGHPFGDKVLKGIAEVLKDFHGIASRYGGEEFAIILEGISFNQVQAYGEALLKKIRSLRFLFKNKTIRITASIGAAFFPTDANNKSMLIKNADLALYYAKENGRDRFVMFKDIEK